MGGGPPKHCFLQCLGGPLPIVKPTENLSRPPKTPLEPRPPIFIPTEQVVHMGSKMRLRSKAVSKFVIEDGGVNKYDCLGRSAGWLGFGLVVGFGSHSGPF